MHRTLVRVVVVAIFMAACVAAAIQTWGPKSGPLDMGDLPSPDREPTWVVQRGDSGKVSVFLEWGDHGGRTMMVDPQDVDLTLKRVREVNDLVKLAWAAKNTNAEVILPFQLNASYDASEAIGIRISSNKGCPVVMIDQYDYTQVIFPDQFQEFLAGLEQASVILKEVQGLSDIKTAEVE